MKAVFASAYKHPSLLSDNLQDEMREIMTEMAFQAGLGPVHKKSTPPITNAQVAEMRRLRDLGMTYREIAAEMNVSRTVVSNKLNMV